MTSNVSQPRRRRSSVQPAVVDPGPQELRDRAEPDARHKVDSESPADAGDVLLVVHGVRGGEVRVVGATA
jgi:hypothetical protein